MARIGILLVVTALALGACAASDPLSARTATADAGTPPACVVPAAPPDGGAVLWTFGFPYPMAGPVAADSSGNTYFVGEGGENASPGQIISINACGSVRWQSFGQVVSWTGLGAATAFVSLDQLIVQTTEVEAFDVAQGTRRWGVELVGFGVDAGVLDDPSVGTNWIGPAASSAGIISVAMSSSKGISVVEIDSGGAPHLVGRPVLSSANIADLIIDSAGNLELNTSLAFEQGTLVSLDPNGQMRFNLPWPCLLSDGVGLLSSASAFIVLQSDLCPISLQGLPAFTEPDALSGAVVIDGDNNLYFGSLSSIDPTGAVRWMAPSSNQEALVLGTANVFGLAAADNSMGNGLESVSISAWSRSTGELTWSQSIPFQTITVTPGNSPFLPNIGFALASPGVLVIGGGNWAIGVSSKGELLDAASQWPTLRGGADERSAALGQ